MTFNSGNNACIILAEKFLNRVIKNLVSVRVRRIANKVTCFFKACDTSILLLRWVIKDLACSISIKPRINTFIYADIANNLITKESIFYMPL